MPDLVATRRSLHAVAELLLAGPQHAAHGTIRLAVTPDGFATVRGPQVSVVGSRLVTGGHAAALSGRSIADVAAEAGIAPHPLDEVYADGCGLDASHVLLVDDDAAGTIHEALRRGAQALAELAPDQAPVLWPEHFDVGVSVDEVNYGVSAGDAFLEVPYAYVGPWGFDGQRDDYWNAPFGAARPVGEVGDLAAFFAEGRRRRG